MRLGHRACLAVGAAAGGDRTACDLGDSGGHVADDLTLVPGVDVQVERGVPHDADAAVVVPGAVVPGVVRRRLELQAAERVADRAGGAPVQHAGHMVADELADLEDPPEGTDLPVVVDPPARLTEGVDGAVLDVVVGGVRGRPAVERRAIEHRDQVGVAVRVAASPAPAAGGRPPLVRLAVAGPQRDGGSVGGLRTGDVQAQPGLVAGDRAVGVGPEPLVGPAIAGPDLQPGARRRLAVDRVQALRVSEGAQLTRRGEDPRLIGLPVAVPDLDAGTRDVAVASHVQAPP